MIHVSPKVKGTEYDAFGRLVKATIATQDVFFGYDQGGQRIYKRVVSSGGGAEKTSIYPMKSVANEPASRQSYVFVGDHRLARVEHGPDGSVEKWFYYLKDHLGSMSRIDMVVR